VTLESNASASGAVRVDRLNPIDPSRDRDQTPFKVVVEQSVDGLLVIDGDGVVMFANPAAKAILSRGDGELVGVNFGFPVSADASSELEVPRPDGTFGTVELRAADITWEGEDAYLLSLRDVTEVRAAERQLSERERHFRLIADAIDDVFWISTPGVSESVYVSPAYERIWGRSRSDFESNPRAFANAIHPDDKAEFLSCVDEFHRQGRAYTAEYRIVRPDGEVRWIHERGYPAGNDEGLGPLMAGVCRDVTARKLVEEEARQERDFAENLIETAQAIVLVLDMDGHIVRYNRYMEQISGYRIEEVRGRSWFETFIPEREQQCVRSLFDTARAGTATKGNINAIRTRDGGERLVEWYDSLLTGSDGGTIGLLAIGQDVTEKLEAQRDRDEMNRRLQLALGAASVGLWDYYPQETTIVFSAEWKRQLGFEPDELADEVIEWADRLHPDDADRVIEYLQDYVARGEAGEYSIEFRLRHRDGSYRWMLANGRAIEFDGGKVTRMLGCHVDITARRRAEERIRFLREIVEQTPDGIVCTDTDFKINYMNKAAEDLFGWSFEEIEGKTADLFNADPRAEEIQRSIYETIVGGKVFDGEALNRRKDGSTFVCQFRVTPILDEKGEAIAYLGAQRDVTDLKHLHEQLNRSRRMEAVGQLAGGIAHDFNNLLTVIKIHTEFALGDLHEKDPLREDIETVKEAGERASKLTRQLLAFSRKQMMTPEVIDLNDIVLGLEPMLRRIIGEDIELKTELRREIGRVHADPGKIEQVLMNLCVNARDAMQSGGTLVIGTDDVEVGDGLATQLPDLGPGTYVLLSISDTGTGMTAEVKERAFEPFYTTKEKSRGTGLGLATVYGIVKQSGGDIEILSEPGQGATLKIYLPRVDAPKTVQTRPSDVTDLTGAEKVLVVEDDDTVRELTRRVLRSAGYEVLTAANAGEALLEYERHAGDIQLVISDVIMPKMSGRELVDRLEKISSGLNVLFMSGYTDEAIARHGILEDGTQFISKPFSSRDLLIAVRRAIDEGGH